MIDQQLRVYGYENSLVCDGSAMPANPGVNPALTITALAEYAMAQIQEVVTSAPTLESLPNGPAAAPKVRHIGLEDSV